MSLLSAVENQSFLKVEKPQLMVIGIACRTSNDPGAGPQDIPKLWQRFESEGVWTQIPNKTSGEVIALYCDYERDHTGDYTCVIGCAVSSLENIPEAMVGKTVPASTFAVFPVRGEFPKSLIDTWGKIWSSDLPRTYSGDYELYDAKEVQVFIAIQADNGAG